jgi:predicted transcriptional regulator
VSTERVTISLPNDVRRVAQRIAEEWGMSFSAVVAEALTVWMCSRSRLVDAWLAEHQATQGAFEEDELLALAANAGVPYVGPRRAGDSAE